MKKILLLFILTISCYLHAQEGTDLGDTPINISSRTILANTCGTPNASNLVINGDFEEYSDLPISTGQILRACNWVNANTATPDYLHRDTPTSGISIPSNTWGNQEVNPTEGGNAYAGMWIIHREETTGPVWREIIRTKLQTPLEANTEYELKFDVSLSDNFDNYTIKFQAYLGSLIPGDNPLELPIDLDPNGILFNNATFSNNTSGWDTITFNFTTGDEAGQEYLYIGGISNTEITPTTGFEQRAYYYVDNVSLKPLTCGTCNDTDDSFPVVSNSYDLGSFNRFFGKSVTSDCSGNVYSLGNWNGFTTLNKFDVSGTIIWSQNINVGAILSSSNVIIEVDNTESIYIKNNDQIFKYTSNGNLSWQIQINDNLFSNRSNFTINKEMGDIYLPVRSNFTLIDNTGTITNFTFPITQESIVRIDTNATVTDLGAFTSSEILNLHYNDGLKVWSRNQSGIEYRRYSPNTDILEVTELDWVNNFQIDLFDEFTPLFFNNITNQVIVYTGNQLASNNNNTRILSIDSAGIIQENILLPVALYIGQHKSAFHAPFAFNKNTGEVAIYADNASINGSVLVSTINSDYQLYTKNINQGFFGSNPFYSRSFHAITYGGDCLYFYGQYRSSTNVVLDGGTVLPSSGDTNNARSVIVRLQDDLTILQPTTKNFSITNQLKAYPNPFKYDFYIEDKLNREIKKVEVFNAYGNLTSSQTYANKNPIAISNDMPGLYFATVYFKDGTIETIKLIKE